MMLESTSSTAISIDALQRKLIIGIVAATLLTLGRTSGKANSGSTRRRSINEGVGGLNARNATLTGFRAASLRSSDSGGRNHRPGAISDRKVGIALNDLLAQQRPLARFPERCRVDDR